MAPCLRSFDLPSIDLVNEYFLNASVIEIELLPSWGLQTRQSLTLLHLSTVVFGMFFSILPAMTIIQVCLFLTSTIGGAIKLSLL